MKAEHFTCFVWWKARFSRAFLSFGMRLQIFPVLRLNSETCILQERPTSSD